ncbi:MAG: asparagine synthase (glutamine-hydrolyzing) [Saprospiraceae bacterium]|jgi:asparagine synthase (glutamine-hydrolysing)|nr:asparagine synthase (glutamine-hydrolyzing) [Saprospiraceae bacterium]
MCGIAGIINLKNLKIENCEAKLNLLNQIQIHRGPDGRKIWMNEDQSVGFAHQRLSIIDIEGGNQPMISESGTVICYNGEIYNFIELRKELSNRYKFVTNSDTEVILAAYEIWGEECVNRFRGMFALALWDVRKRKLFCARDHFGIKPLYYAIVQNTFYFASEIKTLLPFLPDIKTNIEGLKDYLTFQLCLGEKTLFEGVNEVLPAHSVVADMNTSSVEIKKYWEVYYEPNFDRTAQYYREKLKELLEDSVKFHMRSDVPVGAYVSGGLDSSTIALIAKNYQVHGDMIGFTGKFSSFGVAFDESHYAQLVADKGGFDLKTIDITSQDFLDNIENTIYHLDYPVAGPGSFSQYMVSSLAAKHRKVVLGGQGGDEIFGGYTRYLIAYFEQCIKAAINGSSGNGNFVVTYESIIPNLISLKGYKPMLSQFWKDGLFENMDRRYFRLINRAPDLGDEIKWENLENYSSRKTFETIFNGDNVRKEAYFDLMTHFDFKTLLPGLLQVEDRMSMAHGLESRVPLLDKAIVELAAEIPADIKFKDGDMKHIFKQVVKDYLPQEVYNRKDKMGFPTPINQWFQTDAKEYVHDILSTTAASNRDFVNNKKVLENVKNEGNYSRKIWGFLCLEIWQQKFHDQKAKYQQLIS